MKILIKRDLQITSPKRHLLMKILKRKTYLQQSTRIQWKKARIRGRVATSSPKLENGPRAMGFDLEFWEMERAAKKLKS